MVCEFCDRKFKYRKSFQHHMESEHGVSDDDDIPLSALVSASPVDKPSEKEENGMRRCPFPPFHYFFKKRIYKFAFEYEHSLNVYFPVVKILHTPN